MEVIKSKLENKNETDDKEYQINEVRKGQCHICYQKHDSVYVC